MTKTPPSAFRVTLLFVTMALLLAPRARAADWAADFVLPGANGTVRAMVEDANAIYIGGDFTAVGSVLVNHVARIDKATGVVTPLGGGIHISSPTAIAQEVFPYSVFCLAFYQGELWVGGRFDDADGVEDTGGLARWDGTVWKSAGAELAYQLNGSVETLVVADGLLYATGEFGKIGNVANTEDRAVWDGTEWRALGTGFLGGGVNAIAHTASGVYVGGSFLLEGAPGMVHLAKWTGTGWTEVLTELDNISEVTALAVQGTDILVGLDFPYVSNVLRWNGATLGALGSTYRGGKIRTLLVAGNDVYAGGDPDPGREDYTDPDGVRFVTLAKFSGNAWTEPGAGVQGPVHALMASGGQVYAAGEFMQAGGSPAVRIAKWSGTQWAPVVNAGSGGGVGGRVLAVLDAGSKIYVGGDFTVAGGVVANRIACWNKATRTWSALGTGMRGSYWGLSQPSTVNSLAMIGGTLYAGGHFRFAGSADCDDIARWNGTAWSAMGSGTSGGGRVECMVVKGGELYVGGEFSNMNGVDNTAKVARWNGSAWLGTGPEFGEPGYLYARVNALCVYQGSVYATVDGYDSFTGTGGRFQLMKFTGSDWTRLDNNDFFSRRAVSMVEHGGKLLIGQEGGWLKSWDGTTLADLPWGYDLDFTPLSMVVVGDRLYAGGGYFGADYTYAHLAAWDGTDWVQMIPEYHYGSVNALAASGTDLHVGGAFRDLGGRLSHNFATYTEGGQPEIEVKSPQQADMMSGDTWNFGPLFTKGAATVAFTVKNTGAGLLYGDDIIYEGPASRAFYVMNDPAFPVWPGGSATFAVKFAPTTAGIKTAVLKIPTSDSDEPLFEIHLTGEALVLTPPVVKTLAATGVSHDSVTLNGTVNAKGSARDVFFDHGLTTGYGVSAGATPASVSGSSDEAVSVTLTGLQPHTKYNFRVRASGPLGAASGANMTFTTLNRAPVAVADSIAVVPGCTVPLPVMENDMDPDGDTFSLALMGVLTPPSAGKLTKTGNGITFAAAGAFSGQATFSYAVKDAFNGTSAQATVTLTPATCTINPPVGNLTSAGVAYPVQVTATGAWSAGKPPAWITLSPLTGAGDGSVLVAVQPNGAKAQRTATILIGGKPHLVSQAGVLPPSLASPPAVPQAVVGGWYSLTIPTTNLPVTFTAKNLPPGLVANGATGILSGRPTKPGTYSVTLSAANAAAKAAPLPAFEIVVVPLPLAVVGSYQGLVEPDMEINGALGSRLELTTTALGGFTGKLITGTASQAIKGVLEIEAADKEHPRLLVALPRKTGAPLTLRLTLDAATHTLAGQVEQTTPAKTAAVTGWRNQWTKTLKASAYKTLHTFVLEQPDTDPALPQGWSYGSVPAANETTGAVTVGGRLADGATFTTSTFIGPQGQVLLYQSLFGGKGSLAGVLHITAGATPAGNALAGAAAWYKPAPPASPPSKDLVYKGGFGPLALTAEGGAYVPPGAGQVMLGVPNGLSNNVELALDGAPEVGLLLDIRLYNPGAALVNKAQVPASANLVKISTLNPATGAFSGEFTLPGATTALNRKAAFQGLVVKRAGGLTGCGYFLMPESTATSSKNSGRVTLQPLPMP